MNSQRTVHLIGMPQDYGQMLRGVDMGPSALRVAGLEERLERIGVTVVDHGDVDCPVMATQSEGEPKLRFLPAVVDGSNHLAAEVRRAAEAGGFPLILGGDHSISIGTLSGLGQVEPRQGLIWMDAHGDFNTPETTPSGNIHGMALAVALGYGDPRLTGIGGDFPKALETNTVLVGVRDLDRAERELLKSTKVTVFTMRSACAPSWIAPWQSPRAASRASTCRSTWISSPLTRPPASARQWPVAPRSGKPTSHWRCSPTAAS